jgi:osmotically-inducible protein OsmY
MSAYLSSLDGSLAVVLGLSGAVLCGNAIPSGANPIIQTSTEQAPGDEQIKYQVEEQLRTDGRIEWEMLDVEVQHGAVTLYGEVETQDQKGLASVIVSTVPGVRKVINRILVSEPLSKDQQPRKGVWSTLRDVDALRGQMQTLRVQVKNAVVTLSGSVEQLGQMEAAVKAAESVQGINKVVNAITVRPRSFQTKREKLYQEGREEVP